MRRQRGAGTSTPTTACRPTRRRGSALGRRRAVLGSLYGRVSRRAFSAAAAAAPAASAATAGAARRRVMALLRL